MSESAVLVVIMRILCLTAICLAMPSCWAKPPLNVSLDNKTLSIDGRLDSNLWNELRRLPLGGVEEIRLTSRGGSISETFKIIDLLPAEKATLIIVHECMSACASIVIPSFAHVEVENGARISLHGTQYGLNALFEKTKREDGHLLDQSPIVKKMAERERQLYIDRNIDPTLLMLPYVARGKLCYDGFRQRNGDIRFAVSTEYPDIDISPEELRVFGVKISASKGENEKIRFDPEGIKKDFEKIDVPKCAP